MTMNASPSVYLNPRYQQGAISAAGFFPASELKSVKADIEQWPGYEATPLLPLPDLAAAHGVKSVLYKDEGGRFGLGSFKAIGGAYAVQRLVQQRVREQQGIDVSVSQILENDLGRTCGLVVACATDGNHGRSVAWAARLFGLPCHIYVHANVSPNRRAALQELGATVVAVPGVYDDAVNRASTDASTHGWTIVSDTSYPGYSEIPFNVMLGYTVMFDEILDQAPEPITHVFIQCGVGALPASICAYFAARSPATKLIVVEPERAACLLESARGGAIVNLDGDLATLMAGLACGCPSHLAWSVLREGAAAFMTAPEELAVRGLRMLAKRQPAIISGETGAAGLAGFLAASEGPQRDALGLNRDSVVLLIGTEGATDPDLYQTILKLPDDDVSGFCQSFLQRARRNALNQAASQK